MRKALLATLILSPVLLHAQASSPAQPQLALAARPASPAALGAVGDRGTAVTKPLRISTGVVAPKLVHSISVNSDATRPWTDVASNRTVTVGMIIDETGKPTALKIVKSAGPIVDRNVLEAVSQYRFSPGTVSNQPVAFPFNLEIKLVSAR
ncbi:TonB family protein [Edaphobacter sp. HDX4]|uniref:TonB family protein n=1 Tax=Edaphobacter sp. HDX4 TaxID=2794064 RepID=UPI002FE68C74